MKTEEQFDKYMLVNPERREEVKANLLGSGVDWEMQESEEVIGAHTLYVLAVKRTSPTLKQILKGKFPTGD